MRAPPLRLLALHLALATRTTVAAIAEPKTPKETLLDMLCQHVASFFSLRCRRHWITRLQVDCDTAEDVDRCIEVGIPAIGEADDNASAFLMSDCLDAASNSSHRNLHDIASAVVDRGGAIGDRWGFREMRDRLDPLYEGAVQGARQHSAPPASKGAAPAGVDRGRAAEAAMRLWCSEVVDARLEYSIRFEVLGSLLGACHRLGTVWVENSCLETGAANISRITRTFREDHIGDCVASVHNATAHADAPASPREYYSSMHDRADAFANSKDFALDIDRFLHDAVRAAYTRNKMIEPREVTTTAKKGAATAAGVPAAGAGTSEESSGSTRTAFVAILCRHATNFTSQRERRRWIAKLQVECAHARTQEASNKCMLVGFKGIRKVDRKASTLLMTECMGMARKTRDLREVSGSIIGKVGIDDDKLGLRRMKERLDPFYEAAVKDAVRQSERDPGVNENGAMTMVVGYWCFETAEADIEFTVRYNVLSRFLDTCERLLGTNNSESKCLEYGAAAIQDITKKHRAARINECVRYVGKATTLSEVSSLISEFHDRGARHNETGSRPDAKSDNFLGSLEDEFNKVITAAYLHGEKFQGKFEVADAGATHSAEDIGAALASASIRVTGPAAASFFAGVLVATVGAVTLVRSSARAGLQALANVRVAAASGVAVVSLERECTALLEHHAQ